MKYGIKVIINREGTPSAGYTKTTRGWEAWCGEKITSNLNVVFKYLTNRCDYDCYRYVVDVAGD